ncbi:MAG: GNAT family N-acetyltransferase [Parasphingorhabdus sp.]
MSNILIRPAKKADALHLPDIEVSAGAAFRSVPGLEWIADDDVMSAELHEIYIDEGTVWVAEAKDRLVGFVTTRLEFDEKNLHILEIAVDSEQQGQGIGRKLFDTVAKYASEENLTGITLTTFRDLAFNEKFYQKLGFQTLESDKLSPRLRDILSAEAENGLPTERRCAMSMRL